MTPASPAEVRSASSFPELWGIVNATPDSFSDGGRHYLPARGDHPARAIAHGRRLRREGAAVLDVGGESTRPGAREVSRDEELHRVLPVVAGLRARGDSGPLSIDTRWAAVADAALAAGATIVNDVSAGADPEMFNVVARHGAGLVLMHMLGVPATMQAAPHYDDVVGDVLAFLLERASRARAAGIARLWIDPGLGFGKTLEHNLALLGALERFVGAGHPVLLGASRKGFVGTLANETRPDRRVAGSLAVAGRAAGAGVAALRVHDVRPTRAFLAVRAALARA